MIQSLKVNGLNGRFDYNFCFQCGPEYHYRAERLRQNNLTKVNLVFNQW